MKASLDDIVDIIGRLFRQPEEGAGSDSGLAAHMWRTTIRPAKFI